MTQPTKADLAAAVAKLTEENTGLRDLLAAASECAGTVPVSADCNWVAEWRRSTTVLSKIKVLCALDGGWEGGAAYGARVLRECAAEPVAYEVLAEPVPVISDGEPWTRAGVAAAVVPAPSGMQDPAPVARVITDSERTCPESNPGSGAPCYRSGDHGVHRDPDGEEWRTDGEAKQSPRPVDLCTCGHIPADHHFNGVTGKYADCNVCDIAACDAFQPALASAL